MHRYGTRDGMKQLTGKERRRLRGLAHGLKPLVHVGRNGVTDGVIDDADRALRDHELVKIRFLGENELGYWEQRGYSDTADPFTEDRYSDWRSTA